MTNNAVYRALRGKPALARALRRRLMRHVKRKGGHYLWTGAVGSHGTPRASVTIRRGQKVSLPVARIIWLCNGRALRSGQVIVPACGNRLCVGIRCLRAVPRAHVVRSRSWPWVKMDAKGVRLIRRRVADGHTQASEARRCELSEAHISKIVRRERWPEV